ncbi:MAG TPA: hypothetical protein VIQ00_13655 [Chitinophagaceae bacterium]|jgi:hypothetical protein
MVKRLLIIVSLLVCIVPIFSYGQEINFISYYPKDSSLSNATGQPKDSLAYYYPTEIKTNRQVVKTNLDDFMENWFSSTLFCAQSPILFNYYLGHDIYRFLWLRSFDVPVIFTLNKSGDKVWLTTKKLNKQPEFLDVTYKIGKFKKPKKGKIKFRKPIKVVDSLVKADRKAEIIFTQTKQLSINEWNEFELLLKNCSFWDRLPFVDSSGLDGSEWTIEAHFKNKYWFVNRWSPDDNFRIAGEYLITKSGINERIY